ncbi:hypothetical protein PF001_g11556 [Phytophthora fragariae]|uniref:Uncharacterized protein n=2 Tax=Phytophthora fragariae TaxID=53985 RepID=A0A6A3EUB0_9STRA|nr:hypothetical protein PF009_g13009 [Phytophthora fragariae]KAE9007433.1 hypothetical protein PF011_g11127 [Phytophthora fragariae]KAE9307575.1 hypothetical protein PF001_g11556 [Phytophthora fragariae]
MAEVMTKRETYEEFKARRRQEFDSQHAGRSTASQQKLLRVHLRHFLATVGAEIDPGWRQVEACRSVGIPEERDQTNDDENTAVVSFAVRQKRLAVEREKSRAQRHRSAHVIQKFVRRCSKLRKNAAIEGKLELPSTSILIALEVEKPVAPPMNPIVIAPVDGYVDPPRSAALPPYEVVVELLSARDLALGFGATSAFDGKCIDVELLLKRQAKVIARALPKKQFVPSFQDTTGEIQLQDCSLRFAIDLNNDTAQRLTALETAMLERCCVTKVTASLARFKYQAERKKFVATLQAQAATGSTEPEQPSSQESCEQRVSEVAVTELWKKLSGDASGQIYAAMLRGFTERPAKHVEPTVETGS